MYSFQNSFFTAVQLLGSILSKFVVFIFLFSTELIELLTDDDLVTEIDFNCLTFNTVIVQQQFQTCLVFVHRFQKRRAKFGLRSNSKKQNFFKKIEPTLKIILRIYAQSLTAENKL